MCSRFFNLVMQGKDPRHSLLAEVLGIICLLSFHVGFCLDPPWYHTLHAMKGLFIGYFLLSTFFFYVFISPSVVCFCYWFFQYFSPIVVFSRYLSIRCLGLRGLDQDALLDCPIQGLADRRKTTVLSSKASCFSLLFHRANRK